MNTNELAPVAEKLLHSYSETAVISRQFRDDYDSPLTVMAKAHVMRSILQGSIAEDTRYELGADYAEFGRVELRDRATGRVYRLKSESATTIEAWANAPSLFDAQRYLVSPVVMLVYKFSKAGLALAVAGTRGRSNTSRLELAERPVFVGEWGYDVIPTPTVFNQDESGAWAELGEVREDDRTEGQ